MQNSYKRKEKTTERRGIFFLQINVNYDTSGFQVYVSHLI